MLRKFVVFSLMVLAAGACSGSEVAGDQAAQGGPTTEVLMTELSFNPAQVDVRAGAQLKIKNAGLAEHTFTVPDLNIDVRLPAGQSGEASIPDQPGTYDFKCVLPGHAEGGMVGRITIARS
jgi:plastocyanin